MITLALALLLTTSAVNLVDGQLLDCTLARASKEQLLPANGGYEDIQIVGMNDNGQIPGLSIEIVKIRQDEDPDGTERTSPSFFGFVFRLIRLWFRIIFFFVPGFGFGADAQVEDEVEQGRLLADASFFGSVASVKRERFENGDGRVYHIFFTARDQGEANVCIGKVTTCVPTGGFFAPRECIDGGDLYDSV